MLLTLVYLCFDSLMQRARFGLLWLVGIPHITFLPDASLFDGSFWSLWVEIGFYVVLPFTFFLVRGQKDFRIAAIIIALVMFCGSMLASFVTWPDHDHAIGQYMQYIIGRFPNALSNFAWGVLFSALFISRRNKPDDSTPLARFGYVGLGVLITALCWQTWVYQNGLIVYWYAHVIKELLADLATFLLLFFVFDERTLATRLFSAPLLKYFGVISYEWFLLHQPIICLSQQYFGKAGGNLLKYLFIALTPILLTLIASILIYHFFSAPIIEWGRKRTATKSGKV